MSSKPTRHGRGWRTKWRHVTTREWQSVTVDTYDECRLLKGWVEARNHFVTSDDLRIVSRAYITDPDVSLAELAARTQPAGSGVTFGAHAKKWIAGRVNVNGKTREVYVGYVRLYCGEWVDRDIALITESEVMAWLAQLTETRSPYTTRTLLSFVRSIFRDALRMHVIDVDPTLGLQIRVPRRVRQIRFIDHDTYLAFREHVPARSQALVDLLAYTGLRISEAMALQVYHLVLTEADPHVIVEQSVQRVGGGRRVVGATKTAGSVRRVSIDGQLVADLRAHVAGLTSTAFAFRSVQGRQLIYQSWYPKVWRPAVEGAMAAGVLPIKLSPHDLRHSHASWLLGAGVPLVDVSRRLGHTSITMTANTYGHLTPGSADRIRAAIGSVRQGAIS